MAEVDQSSLVMRLEFEETDGSTARDTSPEGTSNAGNLLNGAQFRQEGGEFGGVVDFDGVDDSIDIPGSNDINLSAQAKRTVSLWFRSSLTDERQVLYEEGGAARGLNIYLDQGQLYVGGWNRPENGWSGTYLKTDAVSENTWHQVTLVLDTQAGESGQQSGGLRGYLDGEEFGQGSATQLWAHAGARLGALEGQTKFHDGEASGTGTRALSGSMDDVRVYNRSLSAEEVSQLAGTSQPAPTTYPIGMNLNGISYYSPQVPFYDVFKSSQPWRTYNSEGDRVKEFEDDLVLDENGWVTALPDSDITVATRMLVGPSVDFVAGRYVVLYEGEGTLEYGGAEVLTSESGRDLIDIAGPGALSMEITATDPNQSGDYIRNIRIVPEAVEETYSTEIFTPEFIEKVDPFTVYRFMDWMETNSSEQEEWSNRPTPETAQFDDIGVPVEYMVALANQTDTAPWFTLPHRATDEYVSNFAQYVKDNLDPELDVYVEYSNEVWSSSFAQGPYAQEQGKQAIDDPNLSDYAKRLNWYGDRTSDVVGIWEDVFGAESDRIVGILGAQSASTYTAEQPLNWLSGNTDFPNSDASYDPAAIAEAGIDAVAIAPYFGRTAGKAQFEDEVQSWTNDEDGGLDKLFTEITEGGVLTNGPEGGLLAETYAQIEAYVALTEPLGLELVANEAGQSLRGIQGVENNQVVTNLFIEANRDPRMGDVYREYLTQWFELGGGTLAHFVDISAYGKFGSWGALESVAQESSPKYDALLDFATSSPESLAVA